MNEIINLLTSIEEKKTEKNEAIGVKLSYSPGKAEPLNLTITQIVWRANENGEITYLNRQWQQYTGMSARESLGLEFTIAMPDRDRECFIKEWQQARVKQECWEKECNLKQKDSSYLPFIFSAEPIKTKETEKAKEWIGTFTRVSQVSSCTSLESLVAKLYRGAIDNIQIGFCIWHLEDLEDVKSFRLIAANPASSQVLKINVEEEIGKSIVECFPKVAENNRTELLAYAEVVRTKKPIEFEAIAYGDDRVTDMIFNIKTFPLPNNCMGMAFENITERKEMELALTESMRQYCTVVDSVREVIFQTDNKGCWQFLNPAWTEITGFTIPESLTKPFTDYICNEPERPIALELFQSLIKLERNFFDLEFALQTRDGRLRVLEMNARLNRNARGKILGTIGTINDITERKKIEASLRARANELSQLNSILFRTTAQLKKRNQELDRFSYIVSHDLKAPLRAIDNLSQWLEDDLNEKIDDRAKEYFQLLRDRVSRMENLINGLLEYARVSKAMAKQELVDVKILLDEVIDSLDPPSSFQLETIGEMPVFTTHRLLLEQVFANLIGNAIEHHHRSDGKVQISAREVGELYEFTVADDGPGIAPENCDKIFTIFQTLEARDRMQNTGIGLSIVKKIVEERGEEIQVSSDLGKGAVFRFTWHKN